MNCNERSMYTLPHIFFTNKNEYVFNLLLRKRPKKKKRLWEGGNTWPPRPLSCTTSHPVCIFTYTVLTGVVFATVCPQVVWWVRRRESAAAMLDRRRMYAAPRVRYGPRSGARRVRLGKRGRRPVTAAAATAEVAASLVRRRWRPAPWCRPQDEEAKRPHIIVDRLYVHLSAHRCRRVRRPRVRDGDTQETSTRL